MPAGPVDIGRFTRIATITPGSSFLDPRPQALLVSTAGTLTFTDDAGNSSGAVAVPVGILPLAPAKITAASSAVVAGLYY